MAIFIVDLPIKNGVFPWFSVCLPESIHVEISVIFHGDEIGDEIGDVTRCSPIFTAGFPKAPKARDGRTLVASIVVSFSDTAFAT